MSNSVNVSQNVVIDKPNQFPWKLYDMLHTAEKRNEEHIISWIKDGKAFKVHNRDLFIEEYMKKMFNQTKFKSFQRQLNLWGFERVQNGPDKGSYFHPLFVKGRRECCQRLSRVRLKGAGDKTGQLGPFDKSDSTTFSPHSVSSTATAAETISTTEVSAFPVTITTSSVAGASNTATASPISLLGAFVDVSRQTSTTSTETNVHGDSRQQQFEDLIRYHTSQTSQKRREMIKNAAIGLSPDLSIAVVGAPVYATAADTSKRDPGDDRLQRHQEEHKHEEHSLSLRQQMDQQPFIHHQQQQERMNVKQESQINREQQSRHRNTSSGLEALLSVSAQRRREEELALLKGLSDHGAMSHSR